MSLKIRLRQQGRTNHLLYRLVLTDARARRDGKYVEVLGWYNPHESENEKNAQVRQERILHWLDQGAEMTPKASSLIKRVAPEIAQKESQRAQERMQKRTEKRRAKKAASK